MAAIHGRLNEHDPASFRHRFKMLFVIISVALAILLIRLWYLQVVRGDELRQRSENNSVRLRKIKPARGFIRDTHGQVLVDNQPSFDILFVPNHAKDVRKVVRELQDLYAECSLTPMTDLSRVKQGSSFVPIKLDKGVSMEKLAVVETHSIDLPGVLVEVAPIRKYLCGESLAHVIGYMGEISPEELDKEAYDGYSIGDMIGKYGMEKFMDQYLRGRNGAEQVEVNVVGKEVKAIGRIPPIAGYNVILTIDSYLQQIAWDALSGRAGAVVVMDPRDGAVLALVSSPSFNPNIFSGGISFEDWEKLSTDPLHPMENRAISGQYPPGSTYKTIVAAAALQEGLITPDTSILCTGSFELGNRTYRCWQKNGHGRVNLHRAIVESCDVYFYNLGKLIGVDKLSWYAQKFGFGACTGIDLPREKSGLIPTKAWKLEKFKEPWQLGETVSLAIGQGFNSVTPLQLARAYGAVANGGILWRPRIIKRIETPDGKIFRTFDPEKRSTLPVSKEVLEILQYALWGVVNEKGGTGYVLKRKAEDVCGKTGTSQVFGLPDDEKARRAKRITAQLQDHALFVCFAPYKNPEIVIAVIAEHGGHGGAAAAPVARKIIDAYFARKQGAATTQKSGGF